MSDVVPSPDTDTLPDLVAPERVIFGLVPHRTDEPSWEGEFRVIEIQNRGDAALDVDDIRLRGGDRFRLSFPQPTRDELDSGVVPDPANDIDEWPDTVDPGESLPVRVWFAPEDNLAEIAEMVIETNDVDEPEHVVNLSGNGDTRCIEVVSGDVLDFGSTSVGETSQRSLVVENCSRSSMLVISDVVLTDDDGAFAVESDRLPGDLPEQAASLMPGERATVVVTFAPTAEGSYAGRLTIRSNDSLNDSTLIPIVGDGTDSACPTAVASAWVQGDSPRATSLETAPLRTIMLDGTGSTASDGAVARYEWSVLSRPKGSTQRLLPESHSPNPRIFLDLVGTYEIELKVYDDEGTTSCGEPAIITVVATPEDDIYLELVWDTPSDTEQTDTFGTDLDLHYKHKNGQWNDAPWDIFWRNSQADWGLGNDASDDPNLDIDDTDGAGPEVISHNKPENVEYRVGVFHNVDHYFGGSYATLRIFVEGTLAMELANEYLPKTGAFWEAALIEWPQATVTNISRMHWQFPETP